MKKVCVWFYFALSVLAFSAQVQAQFNTLETPSLRLIYYGKAHEYLVRHVANCFENSLNFHRRLFNYEPSEKITLLLLDLSDYGNAAAGAIPRDHITVFIAPLDYTYETAPANERMNATLNHEIVHLVATDMAAGSDRFFRSIFFGKVKAVSGNPLSMLYSYLTIPREYSPRWYHEGIAVFLETWMAGGLGRALGSYDEMVFRTLALEGRRIYDLVGLESEGTKIDFQLGVVSYLYGTRFMSYLANEYGPESLVRWTARAPESKGYFASQFRQVFGVSLEDAWAQWIQWEKGFQEQNLALIREHPVTAFRPVSNRALGSVSRGYLDKSGKKLYTAVNYPGQVGHIAAIDLETGQVGKISDVKGAALFFVTSLAYDAESDVIFYTADNNEWRDLQMLDLKSRKSRTLQKDARIGDLAFNRADRSLWGVRHFNGISTLVRMPPPYTAWNQIYSLPYGKDLYGLDISPDGKLLTGALAGVDGSQQLVRAEVDSLLLGRREFDILFDFENSNPAGFVFSADGKSLYGSSYYTGVSNIYRYDLAADSMSIVSNCETGFFRPLPVSVDSLLVYRYTGEGFVPGKISSAPVTAVGAIKFLGQKIVKERPVVRKWLAGSPAAVNLDSLTTFSGPYSSFRNIKLASAYPIVEGFKDFAGVGMRLNFSGPIGLNNLDLTTSYTPDASLPSGQRLHVRFNYSNTNWTLAAKYNAGDFYDLFGPTRSSRKGYSLGLKYDKALLYDRPKSMRLNVFASGYGNLERLPDYQNVVASFDKFLTFGASLTYKNQRASLGAVDAEKGVKWQLASTNNYVNKDLFPRLYSALDLGVALPIDHSSVWLRTAAGHSLGARSNPFANFFFGGFGNNWVDHLTEKRYRDYYSLPGFDLNEIGGRNFARVMLEWNLPPLRFRRLGLPGFYSTWARVSLFSTGLMTNFDRRAIRREVADVGGQIDFRILVLSNLKMTLSAGYAVGFERRSDLAKEFMFSLKIL